MPKPKFVNKINFQQEPGTSETVMPSDDMLMYFEKHIIAPAEEECGYGIYSKALEIPIFFVREKTINQKGLAIDCGVSDDLRKLHGIVDEDRFWKLETALVDRGDPIGLYFPKGEFQDQGPEIWVSYEKNPQPASEMAGFKIHYGSDLGSRAGACYYGCSNVGPLLSENMG